MSEKKRTLGIFLRFESAKSISVQIWIRKGHFSSFIKIPILLEDPGVADSSYVKESLYPLSLFRILLLYFMKKKLN